MTQVGNVIGSLVGGAVLSDYAGPVQGKDHRQVHQADLVKDLVVSPLKESGVDGHQGF